MDPENNEPRTNASRPPSLLDNHLLGSLRLGARCALHFLGACSLLAGLLLDLADGFFSCTLDLVLDRDLLRGRLPGRGLLDAGASLRAGLGRVGFGFGGPLGRRLACGLGRNGREDARLAVAGCAASSSHCKGSVLVLDWNLVGLVSVQAIIARSLVGVTERKDSTTRTLIA